MRRSRVFALLVSAMLLLGISTVYTVAVDATSYPVTFEEHIGHREYLYVGSIDLQFDDEVHFKLTIDSPIPETDLDMEVYYDGEIVFYLATGYGYIGDPEIIEEGYFWVPYTGTYDIMMFGYYVPYDMGVDYTLFIDSAEELFNMAPLMSHGLSVGALTSYENNNPQAIGANEKAAFQDVAGAYTSAAVNFQSAFNTNSWTQYSLDPARFCSEDALIVGGWVWQRPVWAHSSFSDAKQFMDARNFVYYIDGTPLTDLSNVQTGPVQKVFENGEVVGYRKVFEHAVFGPGELAELIGTGEHSMLVRYIGPGFDIPYIYFYFWLMPEGWTGPY
ncbi:MAG: hypothetical protein ACFFE2_11565 [Candidatus Thorarchaeota archaeon]